MPNHDHDALINLMAEVSQLRREVDSLEEKVSYYDRLALKWGGACMALMAIGALLSGHFDKIRDKIIGFFQ